MKKATKNKLKKAAKNGIRVTEKVARVVAVDAFALGRGVVRGVKQGMKDIKELDKRQAKRK